MQKYKNIQIHTFSFLNHSKNSTQVECILHGLFYFEFQAKQTVIQQKASKGLLTCLCRFQKIVFSAQWEFGKLVPFTLAFESRSKSLYQNINVSTVLNV